MSERKWMITPTYSGRSYVVHRIGRTPTINDEAFPTVDEAKVRRDELEAGKTDRVLDGITVLDNVDIH